MGDNRIKEAISSSVERKRKELVELLLYFIESRSLPGNEGEMAQRLSNVLKEKGADVFIDPLGNCIGTIGDGEYHLVFDGHMDVVDAGDLSQWEVDPFKGAFIDGKIYGRGSADQKGGLASAIVALSIIKEIGVPEKLKISVVGSVLEEPREGLSWLYIIEEDGIRPDFVVLTEPSSLKIMRGHLGRAEIEIRIKGRSAHGSMPEEGINAVELMYEILGELFELKNKLKTHPTLGKGKLTVTHVDSRTPSLCCAVPDFATIRIDRRLTLNEDEMSALREILSLKSVKKYGAEAVFKKEPIPSYTGLLYRREPSYPAWYIEESHPLVLAAMETYQEIFEKEAQLDIWKFSTNGVATSGIHGIPTIGFGPGDPRRAHTPMEFCPLDELLMASAFYAALPYFLEKKLK